MTQNAMEILEQRGYIDWCSNRDGLAALYGSEMVTAYVGFDPTADSLHVGHLIPLMGLAWIAMMASLNVTKDVRAQLQSHGLGGVQDRHYDRFHYMPQKTSALLSWQVHLDCLADREPVASAAAECTPA